MQNNPNFFKGVESSITMENRDYSSGQKQTRKEEKEKSLNNIATSTADLHSSSKRMISKENDEMMEYKQVKARRTMGYKKEKVAKNNGCDDNKADGGCYVRRRYNIQTSSGQDLVLPFSEVRMLTFLCKLFLNYYIILRCVFMYLV